MAKTFTPEMAGSPMDGFYDNLGMRQGITPGGTQVAGFGPTAQRPTVPAHSAPHGGEGKPVLGFFFSVSNGGQTEYWPLHLGKNTIGCDGSCDVCLPEGTVSALHANILVRRQKETGNILAYIKDECSTNGTMLNGKSLGIEPVECKVGDKMLFGDNYETVLILLDPQKLGLKAAPDFMPAQTQQTDSLFDMQDQAFSVEDSGTQALNGQDFFGDGGTQAM